MIYYELRLPTGFSSHAGAYFGYVPFVSCLDEQAATKLAMQLQWADDSYCDVECYLRNTKNRSKILMKLVADPSKPTKASYIPY